ncbi:glycosyl transferase family 1, partial [Micromonospora aurantiaca]
RVALPSGVQRGEAGWVVAPEVDVLAAALPLAAAEARMLAGPARSRYERTFHPDVITKRLIDIYAGLAGGRPAR